MCKYCLDSYVELHLINIFCVIHYDFIKWKYFRITGHLCGEFTNHRWIPRTKASDAELWCFLWSAPEINSLVNNGEAGDWRRHRVHYDVTVMWFRSMSMTRHPPFLVTIFGLHLVAAHKWISKQCVNNVYMKSMNTAQVSCDALHDFLRCTAWYFFVPSNYFSLRLYIQIWYSFSPETTAHLPITCNEHYFFQSFNNFVTQLRTNTGTNITCWIIQTIFHTRTTNIWRMFDTMLYFACLWINNMCVCI